MVGTSDVKVILYFSMVFKRSTGSKLTML